MSIFSVLAVSHGLADGFLYYHMNAKQQEEFVRSAVAQLQLAFSSGDNDRVVEQVLREQLLLAIGSAVLQALPAAARTQYLHEQYQPGTHDSEAAHAFITEYLSQERVQEVVQTTVDTFRSYYLSSQE